MLTNRTATILGDIPVGWQRDALRNLLLGHEGGDWGDEAGEVAVQVLRSTNFTSTGALNFEDVALRYFTSSKAAKMALKEGDLLLERSGGGPTQPVGRVGFIRQDLPGHWFSNFVQLLRSNREKIEPEFLGWLLLELNRSGKVERLQHQTTQMRNLDFRDYLRVPLPVPEREEQRVIVRVLRTTSDTVTAAEQKLAMARRVKVALMQRLFTCGLSSGQTVFKQTKIGEIPDTWEVIPLGRIATVVSGIALNSDRSPKFYPHRYLTVMHVQRERLELADVRHFELKPSEIPTALLDEGDILVVEGHAHASEIGRAALATRDVTGFAYQNHLFRIRLLSDSRFDRLYLLGVLNSERVRRHWVATCNTSSGLNTINHRSLRRLLIQRPCEKEQKEIAALLTETNGAITAATEEVRALKHLSRSLLQNLLTGSVRLRTAEKL
jgi:type I restriction enzyme, S subunit